MPAHRLIATCGIVAVMLAAASAGAPQATGSGRGAAGADSTTTSADGLSERSFNCWPVVVRDADPATTTSEWTGAGPLLFGRTTDDGGRFGGLRPIWIQQSNPRGQFRAGFFLYPLFSYRVDENTYQWNVLELIRRTDRRAGATTPQSQFDPRGDFEVWPFIFSRETGDPEMSYHALFPIGGTIKNKFGFDRASWVAFPVYVQTDKRGVLTTSVPWPIVRVTSGAAHGFGLWPLFDVRERTGVWKQQYYLWPLGYNNTTYPAPDAPAGTPATRDIGALPLYARRTAPGYIDESYLWPFFGYTLRTQPAPYHETRYFWPFLVQGRGSMHYVNRWGPVYTHSIVKGYDKTWLAWPVLRHAEWTDRGLTVTKTQFLYFLYWSEHQRRSARPGSPAASITHVWPLFSKWDNGAGRQQFQFFSPLEVFFPGNDKVQNAWSPFFALLRREQTAPGVSRTSLLWNAVTWQRNAAQERREFHLGPVLSVVHESAAERIAIGRGLVSFRRAPEGGWRIRWFDFNSKSMKSANASR